MNKICFEGFLLDTAKRELVHNERAVHLEPKSFDVLVTLLELSDRVVLRRELLDLHWNGETVCSGALSQCILSVRKALQDTWDAPRYIKTVTRRGYRFIAKVHRAPQP